MYRDISGWLIDEINVTVFFQITFQQWIGGYVVSCSFINCCRDVHVRSAMGCQMLTISGGYKNF